MKNRNYKQGNKPRKSLIPRVDVIPFAAEINVPTEADFVTLPRTEYMGLVANNALLEAVKRMIEADRYDSYRGMRTILNMPLKEDE